MNHLPSDKPGLRREAAAARRALPGAQRRRAARLAAEHFLRIARRKHWRRVAVYLSVRSELDTAPLIEALRQDGIALYAPRLGAPGRMSLHALDGALRRNRYGIAEPRGSARAARLDAVVVPLLAFDRHGRRLGMGGGYYDRLLAGLPARRPWRVGYGYALQERTTLPAEAHDASLDAVVTERGWRRF